MALIAGIGDAEFLCQQWIWDVEAVVAAWIAAHVGGVGHVAFHATAAGGADGVVTMLVGLDDDRFSIAGGVALHAEGVVFEGEFEGGGVGVVTVATADALVSHFAEHEGAVDVVFAEDLAVGVVEIGGGGEGEGEVVGKEGAVMEVVVELATAAVAGGAVLGGAVGGDGALGGEVDETTVVGIRLVGEVAVALGGAPKSLLFHWFYSHLAIWHTKGGQGTPRAPQGASRGSPRHPHRAPRDSSGTPRDLHKTP